MSARGEHASPPWIHRNRTTLPSVHRVPPGWPGPYSTSHGALFGDLLMECESCRGKNFKQHSLFESWQCTVCGGKPAGAGTRLRDDTLLSPEVRRSGVVVHRGIADRGISDHFFGTHGDEFPRAKALRGKDRWEKFGENLLVQKDPSFWQDRPLLAQPPSSKIYFVRQTPKCWRWDSWAKSVQHVQERERAFDWHHRPVRQFRFDALDVLPSIGLYYFRSNLPIAM